MLYSPGATSSGRNEEITQTVNDTVLTIVIVRMFGSEYRFNGETELLSMVHGHLE